MRSVLAADLGGTKCRFGLVSEDLRVHHGIRIPTPRSAAEFVVGIRAAFRSILTEVPAGVAPPTAIGLGVAGVVAPGGRRIQQSTGLPLAEVAVSDELEREFGLPTTVLNDGHACAWGEFVRQFAPSRDPLLALFLGTGVGMGMIVDGRPYSGANNTCGEAGHALYRRDGRRCPCGRIGCYEAYMGGRVLGERATELLGADESGAPRSGAALLHAAATDTRAAVLVEEAAQAAEAMVCNLVHVLNPRFLVLGGGVIDGWPDLLPRIEAFTRARCAPAVTERLEFHRSQGGSDAILWGAAAATGVIREAREVL